MIESMYHFIFFVAACLNSCISMINRNKQGMLHAILKKSNIVEVCLSTEHKSSYEIRPDVDLHAGNNKRTLAS